MKAYDLIGWFGVGAILGAYALITFGAVTADDWIYNATNLFGAAGIVVSSYKNKDYQPVALNAVWFFISLLGLLQILLV